EYWTITSVPPAMGSHTPGSRARSDSTAVNVPGATSLYSAGWALTLRLPDVRLLPRLQRFACIPCSGRDCRIGLRGFLRGWAAASCLRDDGRRGSFLECKCRIGRRRSRERTAARI